MRRRGFTLVEVTAALTIGAFVTVVAVGALKSVSDGVRVVRAHSDLDAELRFVTERLRADLENLYRDGKRSSMKLVSGVGAADEPGGGTLVFYTVLHEKARAVEPEADIYEVEYGLITEDDRSRLVRRVWPHPHEDWEPGGVLTTLSDRIVAFQVRFFDGQTWVDAWSLEDQRRLPDLAEVLIALQPDPEREPVIRRILVQWTQASATLDSLDEANAESEPDLGTTSEAGVVNGGDAG